MLKLALAVIAVGVADWLLFTRVGGFFSDFDYRYWPLSRARLISVFVLTCTVASMLLFVRPNPDNPPMWVLLPFGMVLIGYLLVGYRDFSIQRRVGYRSPSRYVDRDEY
jgi:hypothetical protein